MEKEGKPYQINEGDGAFYGPKIDIKVTDAIGREWQLSTIQVDFTLPERFNLEYVGQDGERHRPVMVHRAILGSLERFIGVLTEHYAGAFPTWLAPVQARILNVTDAQLDYAKKARERLAALGVRVEVDTRNEKLGFKVREAQLAKIPYILVVGDREVQDEGVNVRLRSGENAGFHTVEDAAAMILSDDNFATIIKAVSNGRNVYRNIKNAILFLLSGNTAGILAVLYTSIAALPVPFAPVHLLFINLLTDSLPALAIGMEPADPSLLSEKPRDPKKGILTSDFMAKMLSEGLLIAVATMTAFHLGLPVSPAKATTMAFATLTLARLFHGFNCRSEESMFKLGFRSNKYSVYAFLAGVAFLAAVLFIPGLHSLFSVVSLGAADVLKIAGLAFAPTAIIQIIKAIQDKRR